MSDTSKTSTAEDGEPNREDADSRRVVIEVECDRRINYAMQQNDVPIVKLLRIKNVGDPIEGLQVRVSLKNGLAEPETFRIDRLGEGQVFTRESVDLRLDSERLSAQTEREATALEVSVSQDTAILDELTRPLEILAYNEWGGVSGVPEILAAFVTPNHPVIAGILARAKGRLEALTGDPTMSGYQVPDRRRTKATVQAIYEAVVAMDLAYLGVPASFEDEGQKVRLPDQIRAFGQGNCLDLSLLLAGALEQAGLHPILVMIKGHAFVAVWVVEESFAEPLIDDAARLLKRIELGEIVAFEATAVTTHPPTAFDAAERNVRSYLADDSRFSFGIDLRAARKMRIRPLPLRAGSVADEPTAADVDEKVARPIPSEFPVLSTGPGPVAAPTADEAPAPPPAPGGRMEIWKRRLLDLSLRNRLLNFKKLRTTFELMVPDIARLEDRLAEGKVFSLMPRPTLAQEGGVRDLEVHRQRTGEDAVEVLLREDLENGRLHAHGDAEALAKDLVEIYRRAKSDIEETGANTLYLALGFLEWYEAESSSLARRAPIILLPITLTRRSVNEGFRLKASGGDARVNVTLLEKLKQEFRVDVSSLLELPEDESGLDVKLILDRVRAAVVNLARWRVRDEAAVGIFAFNKVTMWEDLEANAEKLLENAVVRHLVETPKDPFGNPEDMLPRAEDVDRELSAEDMLCPMDADSSQLAAVIAAARGRTFVLQGPPGTGKSQTITNLIAHAIGNGRRVLFVAEKRAALEVVHGRLSRLGLEPFCLEVHSNKASKREVLDQLAQVRDLAPQSSSDDWDRRATELDRLKGELNDYAERLHRRHAIGLSVFGATSMVVGLKGAPRRKLNIQRFAGVDADRWEVLRRLASRLESAADQVVPIADHPLRAVGRAAWSTRIPGEVDERSTALEAAIGTLEAARDNFADQLGWPLDDRSSGRTLEVAADVAQRLRTTPGPERRLLEVGGWVELRAGLEIVLGELRQRNALRERLLESYDEGLFALDGDEIRHALRAADEAFSVIGWFKRRAVWNRLRPFARTRRAPDPASLMAHAETLGEIQQVSRRLADPAVPAADLFGRRWQEGEADADALQTLLDWVEDLRGLLAALPPDEEGQAIRARVLALATDDRDRVLEEGPGRQALQRLVDSVQAWRTKLAGFGSLLDLDAAAAWGSEDRATLGDQRSFLRQLADARGQLKDWCHWRLTRSEAEAGGLGELVNAVETGQVEPGDLRAAVDRSLVEAWLEETIDADDLLRRFQSHDHERKIRAFREVDEGLIRLAREVIVARAKSRVPAAGNQAPDSSELGILNRELQKKRRHMPLRKLFQSLPGLLPRLKPCLLMSPLSVAQYLSPDMERVDLVIFDEASQMPVWDSIGAIARGNAVIVVGDSKQLPPTSFFEKAITEDDDIQDGDIGVDEVESILDECEAANLPTMRLLWHYRSQHESLIAFSNAHYYDNRLMTFPSVVSTADGLGVSLRHLEDGLYDRGASRTNQREAEFIVAEIVRRIHAAGDPASGPSLGVVAFSQAQQRRIEDLLDEARRQHPEIEDWFGEAAAEPVFVKNLENVQGDERDVILFSICYGPDAAGKITMAFGPLNRDGGERRLNVAITRARREVVVVSSLRGDQIDLARVRALGVRHLKSFLDYADRGPRALVEASAPVLGAAFDSPFEKAVRDALVARGHDVDLQVGCSGYRIDLAVKHPDQPGRYLLGIECDGAAYHSAASARDRDRLRQSVLERLGWTICRIWSTDWWQDPRRQIEELESEIAAALTAMPSVPPTVDTTPIPAAATASTSTTMETPVADDADLDPAATEPVRLANLTSTPSVEPTLPKPPPPGGIIDAVYPGLEPARTLGNAEQFYERAATKKIEQRLIEVVLEEGPVHRDRAFRRVGESWGLQKVTARFRAQLQEILDLMPTDRRPELRGDFLWPKDLASADYRSFRRPGPDGNAQRKSDEIPLEEFANAAAFVLHLGGALPIADLERETARLFGFSRMGKLVQEQVTAGLTQLAERGGCRLEGEMALPPR